MTLSDYKTINRSATNPLGKLSAYITSDGSISLKSSFFRESFHCSSGARKESEEKFILPIELDRFTNVKRLRVLDVCVGMGYNTACLLEYIKKTNINLEWWGLELDKRPLSIALEDTSFRNSWSPDVLLTLKTINQEGEWSDRKSKGKLLWGDARNELNRIPNPKKFDLILHDGFSPSNCPELWSEEFLRRLSMKLNQNGRLITYCTAAAIRGSLRRARLNIFSLKSIQNSSRWSVGTVGIIQGHNKNNNIKTQYLCPLSVMEEEHLHTRAAVPYRDPKGNCSPELIIRKRLKEQQVSTLQSTSSWKRRWNKP